MTQPMIALYCSTTIFLATFWFTSADFPLQHNRYIDGDQILNVPSQQGQYYMPPALRSYVIYDGDVSHLPDNRNRPQILSGPRSWHLQFNQRNDPRRTQPTDAVSYHTVSSNLIQILDEPSQRKYYGPFDGNAYMDKNKRYPDFLRPLDVPRFEVVYPYNGEGNSMYKNIQLPDKFPSPFSPNVNFKFVEPPPANSPRRDFGLFRTQTINYHPESSPDSPRRNGAKDLCNYIRLNDKGFPLGNEMCGRTVSDYLLAEDYPTTGQLVLEHRKRYRGAFANSREEYRVVADSHRMKRSTDDYPYNRGSYSRHTSGQSCCFDTNGGNYVRTYNGQRMYGSSLEYDNEGYRHDDSYDSYGYPQREGQAYDIEEDNIRGDTSNNRGLTSYLSNRGRDRDRYNGSDESDDNEDDRDYNEDRQNKRNNRRNNNNNNNNNNNTKNNSSNHDNTNSRNSTNSDRHRGNSDGSGKRKMNRHDNDDDSYDNDEDNDRNNRNGGNNYGYVRNHNSDKRYGSDDGYNSRRNSENRGSYGSTGNYGQGSSYGSTGNYGQGSSYGSTGSYGQGGSYGQTGSYGQGSRYGQSDGGGSRIYGSRNSGSNSFGTRAYPMTRGDSSGGLFSDRTVGSNRFNEESGRGYNPWTYRGGNSGLSRDTGGYGYEYRE